MPGGAFIFEAIRTARGKAKPTGGLAEHTPLDMLTLLFKELECRTNLDVERVEDVVIGTARQHYEQASNVGRLAPLMAGWPNSVGGGTVSRACASGLDAVNIAAARIKAGDASLIVAGGVESLSRVPMGSDMGPLWHDPKVSETIGAIHMGVAADLVATLLGYEREEIDQMGVRSQAAASAAQAAGRFARSLVPVASADGTTLLDADEHVRPGTTLEQLAAMPPAFAEMGAAGQDQVALRSYPQLSAIRHLHTRGTSPSLADGAGVLLLGDEGGASAVGCRPRARIVASATVGASPIEMMTAGQEATTAVIARAGLKLDDIDRFEFAEAFGALCLKFQRELGVGDDRFNVNGGTIAIGHAFGATGPFLLANLIDELERCRGRYGVVSISGATGIGVATLVERID
ncbi:acetyl-CoA C-acyltransferase [Specibacter sp. RAF43]|uniref:acetyl-CoA C-acyltransferase n=1 Tax=Specibacter sp. RAF43 TaxID=3233057 RepID=UPI003F95EAA2